MATVEQDSFPTDGLATVPDAMRFLVLSRQTIYTLMNNGTIPSCKIGGSRRVAWAALRRYVSEQTR